MFNYTFEFYENGKWTLTDRFERPFYDECTLDESLDLGTVRLWMYGRKKRFEPFTPVRFGIYEVNDRKTDVLLMSEEERAPYLKEMVYRVIGDSTVEQRRFAYNMPGLPEVFIHDLQLIELTKIIERDVCDTMTFTNKLGRCYTSGAVDVDVEKTAKYETSGGGASSMQNNHELLLRGEYRAPISTESECATLSGEYRDTLSNFQGGSINLIDPDGKEEIIGTCSYESRRDPFAAVEHYVVFNATKPFTPHKEGIYKIVYSVKDKISSGANHTLYTYTWTYNIEVIDDLQPRYNTVTDILNRILSAGVTRRRSKPQKYTLDPEIAEKFGKVAAPEFYIPRGTLWDALSVVGGFIHGIPRLKWNEAENKPNIITYDLLGGTTERTVDRRICAYNELVKADCYCDRIDSIAENVLNTRNRKRGTITDPCIGAFKSLRCETSGVKIEDASAVFKTSLPIDTVSKMTVKNTDDNTTGDITPYLFEAAEYDGVLSEYTKIYPHSKAYALRYEQGSKIISGFDFKLESAMTEVAALTNPAIENILRKVGVTVPRNYNSLTFQIEYVPYINMRVVQKKTYGAGKGGGTMFYNQGANRVESEVYGENMKGTVARLGNGEVIKTFYIEKYDELPKCGELVDGMYVSNVQIMFEKYKTKCTLTLTPDFNRLAQYLGTFTEFRLYDVSERQSVDRYINYGQDVVIGKNETDIFDAMPDTFMNAFVNTLSPSAITDNRQVSGVSAWGEDDGASYNSVLLPCSSFGCGNSLVFTFEYEDNYSAGDKSGKTENTNIRVRQAVPYCNEYGEFKYLNVRMVSSASNTDPHELPSAKIQPDGVFGFTHDDALVVEKDSREKLNVTLQTHLRANTKSVVIGSRLTQNNLLVADMVGKARPVLYLLKNRLHTFNDVIDIGDDDIEGSYEIHQNGDFAKHYYLWANGDMTDFKAWAVIDPDDYRLYVGKNLDDIESGENPNDIYFTFLGGNYDS